MDDLKTTHAGKSITNCHTLNGHAQPRISITSDDHLYITLNYLVDGKMCWSILYLDDLDNSQFQVEVLGGVSNVNVEEFYRS